MSEAPPPPAPRRVRLGLTPRRLAVLLGVWIVAVGAALLIADALDSPVGEGARDEAQAVAPGGPVQVPGGALAAGDGLPPLALVLDRPLPDGVGDLPPIRQAVRLSELARSDPDPRRLVELGSVLQLLGDPENATRAYRAAAARAPDDLAARAGLAMVEGAGGGAGLGAGGGGAGGARPRTPGGPARRLQPGLGRDLSPPRRRRPERLGADGRARRGHPPREDGHRAADGAREQKRRLTRKNDENFIASARGLNRRLSRACDHAAALREGNASQRPEIPRDRSARRVSS